MKRHILLLLITCLVVAVCLSSSCNQIKADTTIQLDCDDSVQANRDGILVDSFFYVVLESGKESVPIGFIQRIEFLDSLILIQDDKGVYAFNMHGKYLFRIGDRGHGPGEYINVSGLWVSKQDCRIYIGDSFAGKILSYSIQGKYIETIVPPDNSLYLIHQADYIASDRLFVSRYAYGGQNTAYSEINLSQMSTNDIDSYGIHSDEIADRLGEHPYSIRNNAVLYVLPFDNNIYEYSDGAAHVLYNINSGKHILTEKEKDNINELFISAMSRNYYEDNFIGFTDIFETPSYVLLNSLYDYYIIQKENNRVTCHTYFLGDPICQLPLLRISSIKDDFLVSILTPHEASRLQFSNQLSSEARLLYDCSKQIDAEDNPILLLYKISMQ